MEALADLGDRFGVPMPDADAEGLIEYSYYDESGELLFQVVKGPGRKYRQRRPDGNGGWVWNRKGVRHVLYRLLDLLSRHQDPVHIVEGEKDADRLAAEGLLATTNPGGAGKWREEYNRHLRSRDVIILPDNDVPGRRHAKMVASSLSVVANSIKIVELPDLPEKGDVSDWLNRGHSLSDLQALVDAAPLWQPESEDTAHFPQIIVNDRQLRDVIKDAWSAIRTANDPPRLFVSSGKLSRLIILDNRPYIEHLSEGAAYGLLLRVADWHIKA